MKRFYFDTAIFRDYYENREDRFRPIGEWAFRLLAMIKANNFKLIISDMVLEELRTFYSKEEINKILAPFKETIVYIEMNEKQGKEAIRIAKSRNLPRRDAAHAIISRDNELILIARDNHFRELADICKSYKPEDII